MLDEGGRRVVLDKTRKERLGTGSVDNRARVVDDVEEGHLEVPGDVIAKDRDLLHPVGRGDEVIDNHLGD